MRSARIAAAFCLGAIFSFSAVAQADVVLSQKQVRAFRSWLVTIVEDQISRGPNPRWFQQDCAGLVRFAVSEAVKVHDENWRKANGFSGRILPGEIGLSSEDREKLKLWQIGNGQKSNFARAITLIQNNSEFLGKTLEQIEPGDLLFFDQGDEQHLMMWTGRRIVYHNGSRTSRTIASSDNGLRAVSFRELSQWRDTRWLPTTENPNFVGFFRFKFLNNAPRFGQSLEKGTL